MIINAADGPFLAPACYLVAIAEKSMHLFLGIPSCGGYVGFTTTIASTGMRLVLCRFCEYSEKKEDKIRPPECWNKQNMISICSGNEFTRFCADSDLVSDIAVEWNLHFKTGFDFCRLEHFTASVTLYRRFCVHDFGIDTWR